MTNLLFLRLILRTAPMVALLAIASPLTTSLTSTQTSQSAIASTLKFDDAALDNTTTDLAELPNHQLKDDDDDDDDGGKPSGANTTTNTTTTTTRRVSYTDISNDYWASEFIYRLEARDILVGFPSGQFRPDTYLTKAHYASIIANAFNTNPVREVVTIRNVSQSYWAYTAIQKAYSIGFLNLQPDNSFNPEANMTKLELLVMLGQALGYTEVTSEVSVDELLSVFADADKIPTEYRVIVASLVEKGVLVNYPTLNQLNLEAFVTRAEACSYIYQAMASKNLVERFYSQYIVDVFGVFQETETVTTVETTTNTSTDIPDRGNDNEGGGDDDDDGGDDDDDDDD